VRSPALKPHEARASWRPANRQHHRFHLAARVAARPVHAAMRQSSQQETHRAETEGSKNIKRTVMKAKLLYSKLIGAVMAASALAPTAAYAQSAPAPAADDQSAPPKAEQKGEVIIVTGTRTEGRTVTDSPVPVDVFTTEAIEEVSYSDTHDVLKTLVPSYTIARQPISDGATFIRPASLRGLSSDKTLVLVNSKRRHRAALVSIGGSGTQGPDVATIPASALKTVEVLRDGAAAQYGSDAIAGVINFILKDAPEGGEIQFQAGQYYESDGEDVMLAANLGIPIFDSGFLNISVESTSAQPTDRGQQWRNAANGGQSAFDVPTYVTTYPQFAALFPATENFNTNHVQIWGQPEAEAFRTFFNAGYDLSETASLYGFANYSNSTSDGDFNYRFPDPEFVNAAGFPNATNPNGANTTTGPAVRTPDGRTYTITSRFPAGYTPRFGGNVVDYSFTGGIKGEFFDGLSYDFSARYGNDKIAYTLSNTTNPSLGPGTPTDFHPGDLISDELAYNADFAWSTPFIFKNPLEIGFGLEYRKEGYEIVRGEVNSWVAGPYARQDPWDFCTNEAAVAARTPTAAGLAVIAQGSTLACTSAADPVYRQMGVGSDGFPGYSPLYSGSFERDSYAAYVDFASDVTDFLFLDLALRAESYSDFGDTFDYKLAGRWKLTDSINLRGSIGTGFRAPTPGQLSTINVSTRFPAGEPQAVGLFPATNPVAIFLGAKPLEPETSTNYSFGATGSFGPFDLTVDLYKIEIEDQFQATATITVDTALRNALLAANVPGADTIGGVNFFQNAFDAEASGIDIVGTYTADWVDGSETTFTASANYNYYDITKVKIGGLFGPEEIYDFEHYNPKYRGVFTVNHKAGIVSLMGRLNYYGKTSQSNILNAGTPAVPTFFVQKLNDALQLDLEIGIDINEQTSLSFGARNLLDDYPDLGDPALAETSNGRLYRSDSIVDWQGGFYYGRVKYSF
jgi:iron complex outermembrane recepter protein